MKLRLNVEPSNESYLYEIPRDIMQAIVAAYRAHCACKTPYLHVVLNEVRQAGNENVIFSDFKKYRGYTISLLLGNYNGYSITIQKV